jgi:hypothetical protein
LDVAKSNAAGQITTAFRLKNGTDDSFFKWRKIRGLSGGFDGVLMRGISGAKGGNARTMSMKDSPSYAWMLLAFSSTRQRAGTNARQNENQLYG